MIKQIAFIYFLFDRATMHGYVGKAADPQSRFRQHWRLRFIGKFYVHYWLRQLFTPPEIRILRKCNENNWQKCERYWISKMKREGWTLTNVTAGGESTSGYHHTEETKRKQSLAHTGKVLTEEHRKNIGLSAKGRTPWNKGKNLSKEHRESLSKAHTGKVHSEEHRKTKSVSAKEAWAEGKYDGRDASFRNTRAYRKKMREAAAKRWSNVA